MIISKVFLVCSCLVSSCSMFMAGYLWQLHRIQSIRTTVTKEDVGSDITSPSITPSLASSVVIDEHGNMIMTNEPSNSLIDGIATPSTNTAASFEKDDGGNDDEADENNEDDDDDDDDNEAIGHQVLLDFLNIDSKFLESEENIRRSINQLISKVGFEMISCRLNGHHNDTNNNLVSLFIHAILLDGYITIHTWPSRGAMTIDIYTTSETMNLPTIVQDVKDLFVRPIPSDTEEDRYAPFVNWVYKRRGYILDDDFDGIDVRADIGTFGIPFKEQIGTTVKTPFQEISFYDTYNTNRARGLSEGHRIAMQYEKDRVVYLNGVLQSTKYGDAAYHEALVHPAMLAHPHPKRVVIIGGGEGATLREVLKYQSVEAVTMVEIDEGMVRASQQYLPQWSDCSSFTNNTDCFTDPRTELYFEDAGVWFVNRYSNASTIEESTKYDVVIMDSLDPTDEMPFAACLFTSDLFVQSIYNSLTTDGVFVSQVGTADTIEDPPEYYKNDANFVEKVAMIGFLDARRYIEGHGGFGNPWSYLLAVKSYKAKQRWFSNQATTDLIVHHRMLPSTTDAAATPLRYFDGATMKTYQYPDRITENKFCLGLAVSDVCSIRDEPIDREKNIFSLSHDVSAGQLIRIIQESFVTLPSTIEHIYDIGKIDGGITRPLNSFFALSRASNHSLSDPSISPLVSSLEHNQTSSSLSSTLERSTNPRMVYSPFIDRHHLVYKQNLLQSTSSSVEQEA